MLLVGWKCEPFIDIFALFLTRYKQLLQDFEDYIGDDHMQVCLRTQDCLNASWQGFHFMGWCFFKGQKSGSNHKFWIIALHLVWFWEPRTLQAPVGLWQMWEDQWPWSSPLGKKSFHTVSSTTCTHIHTRMHTHTLHNWTQLCPQATGVLGS